MNPELMETIEALQHRETDVEIFDIIHRAIARYGFERFIISGLPDRGQDPRPLLLLSGWPPEWLERYAERGYVHIDPVVRHCFSTTLPFAWSQAPYDPESDRPAKRVVDEAREFGMPDGICVPIHMENGTQGAVSLVGSTGDLTEQARLELHVLALYAHGRLRFLKSVPPRRRAITRREAEVLKWAASGKTAYEIAAITGLSERTVNQHCLNAQGKLGTSNRTHTVVEAIRHKLIAL